MRRKRPIRASNLTTTAPFPGLRSGTSCRRFCSVFRGRTHVSGCELCLDRSKIDLGDQQGTQTNAIRPLQGQSPYVANLSLAYLHPEGNIEATLLYNISGAHIRRLGTVVCLTSMSNRLVNWISRSVRNYLGRVGRRRADFATCSIQRHDSNRVTT